MHCMIHPHSPLATLRCSLLKKIDDFTHTFIAGTFDNQRYYVPSKSRIMKAYHESSNITMCAFKDDQNLIIYGKDVKSYWSLVGKV